MMKDKHLCPVCGQFEFERYNSMDYCDVCNWCDDAVQEKEPDYKGGANRMSLTEAKAAFAAGETIT